MQLPRHLPSILIIYAERDTEFQQDISAYFTELWLNDLFDSFKFHRVQDLHHDWWSDHRGKYDMVVLLISIRLTTHRNFRAIFPKLKREFFNKRISLVPILIGECLIDLRLFNKLELLPLNKKAADSGYWPYKDNFYTALFPVLEDLLHKLIASKSEQENLWLTAQKSRTVASFNTFIEQYPNSKYALEAKETRNKILEDQLWQRAKFTKNISSYYDYLRDSPLQTNKEEAALAISKLENDEVSCWQEIEGNKYLEDLLKYRTYFSHGKHKLEVNDLISKKLRTKLEKVEYEFARADHHNHLKDLAYENLHPNELLSFETSLRYIEGIQAEIGVGSGNVADLKFWTKFWVCLFSLAFFTATHFKVLVDYYDFSSALFVTLLIGLNLHPRIYQDADEKYLRQAAVYVQKLNIKLKVAFLSQDNQNRKAIIKSLFEIENEVLNICDKKFFKYFTQVEEIDDSSLGKGKKTRKKILHKPAPSW